MFLVAVTTAAGREEDRWTGRPTHGRTDGTVALAAMTLSMSKCTTADGGGEERVGGKNDLLGAWCALCAPF